MNRFTDWPSVLDVLDYYGAPPPRNRLGWAVMRCPFHEDAHASAAVHADLNIFYCHGCQISLTGLGLVMRQEGLNQREARTFAKGIFAGGESELHGTGGRSRTLFGGAGNPADDRGEVRPGGRRRTVLDQP